MTASRWDGEPDALRKAAPSRSRSTAEVIVAEVGVDMSRFPTAGILVSGAGRSPRNDESAGKRRNTRVGKGGQWLKATVVQAVWSATRKKDRHLRELFVRLKGERGPRKAIVAVAAEIMRSACYMLTRDEVYQDPQPTTADPARKEREAKRLVSKLKRLGCEVEMQGAAK